MIAMITKAGAVGDKAPEDLVIQISGAPEIALGKDWREEATLFYKEQGEGLARLLYSHLPGGTFDQLLRALLEYRASLLKVVFEPERCENAQSAKVLNIIGLMKQSCAASTALQRGQLT